VDQPITCTVNATIESGKKTLLTTRTTAPFTFSSGVLTALFGDAVSTIVQTQTNIETAATIKSSLSSTIIPVGLQVSQRFVDAMGSDIFLPATLASLASAINAQSVFNMQVCLSLFFWSWCPQSSPIVLY
jgi:hypothetical protein